MAQQSGVIAFPSGVASLKRAKDWTLTAETFDLLLKQLDDNRDEAAKKYVSLYSKLVRYFDFRGCSMPDWEADETMVRIARKIEQGVLITNFQGFMYGVARNIVIEAFKNREKQQNIFTDLREEPASPDPGDQEHRLICLQAGLCKLPAGDRELLLAYYTTCDDKNMKHRRELARREGISINALRVRVHRLKTTLEKHVTGDREDKLHEKSSLHGSAGKRRRLPLAELGFGASLKAS